MAPAACTAAFELESYMSNFSPLFEPTPGSLSQDMCRCCQPHQPCCGCHRDVTVRAWLQTDEGEMEQLGWSLLRWF